eukprot:TRINITY_DN8698_c0_g1_i1.p1 TRINITY_DN8698_c0_g1~~TRINITY_DN8698_c0_g1_i1.p1  ORF type:complete len:241 (-),score=49.39 TRINITY_DN8698_c0_g1_i1:197-919(-)
MHAVVTGGSRGIGAAIAMEMASHGCTVTVVGRSMTDRLMETLRLLKARFPSEHAAVAFDVGHPQEVDAAMEAAGSVDVLVNAAGVCHDRLMVRRPGDAHIAETVTTNLLGPIYMCRAVAKRMTKQRSGVIINIGSVVGAGGNPGQSVYSASKSGLMGLTCTLAKELGPFGVRANMISPGYIETDMTGVMTEEAQAVIRDRIPGRRFGQPEEVASLAWFLASPAAAYINGQVIGVDGGLRL